MSPNRDQRLAATAMARCGVFSRADAFAAGFRLVDVQRRVEDGVWTPLHRGIYRASTTPVTPAVTAVALLLRLGPPAVFSHITAARLSGVDVRSESARAWITTAASATYLKHDDLELTRTRHLPPVVVRHGQPVTDLPRLIVDLAAVLDRDRLGATLHDVVRRGLVRIDDVLAEAERIGGGRAGLALLGDVAAEFDPAFESAAEATAFASLSAAGVVMQPQYEIWDGPFLIARIDLADPELRFGVEVDGFAFHSSRAAIEHDRRRDRRLHRLGWTIQRFGATEILRRPRLFVSDVLATRRNLRRRIDQDGQGEVSTRR